MKGVFEGFKIRQVNFFYIASWQNAFLETKLFIFNNFQSNFS